MAARFNPANQPISFGCVSFFCSDGFSRVLWLKMGVESLKIIKNGFAD
jgi:hypothetical protein